MADYGAFHAGVQSVVDFAEHVVRDLAVDDAAAVLVEVALLSLISLVVQCSVLSFGNTNFLPLRVSGIDGTSELREVEVQKVRSDPDNRPILLVELLHARGILPREYLAKTPQVGPSYVLLESWVRMRLVLRRESTDLPERDRGISLEETSGMR